MRIVRAVLIFIGICASITVFGWLYTPSQLKNSAVTKGVFDTPEQGMLTLIEKDYAPGYQAEILYSGPNSFDGSNPHVWYVIARVRAAARADGSELSHNGCDSPGSYFLNTKDGWVRISEGKLPTFMGFWMKVFGWAGEGGTAPSIDWAEEWKDKPVIRPCE